jgi:hypothetical protein
MAVVVNSGVICGSPIPEFKSNRIRITVYRPAGADTVPLSLHRVDVVSVTNVSELYPASIFIVDVNRADSTAVILLLPYSQKGLSWLRAVLVLLIIYLIAVINVYCVPCGARATT